MEEHIDIVKKVLKILNDNKLLVQIKKCWFHQTKVEYLGVIILKDSVKVDPIKVKGVIDWPEPKDKWEIYQSLGFCNFYQQFIRGFAQLAKSLIELTGKKAWKWSEEERRAFAKLKKFLTSTPTLAIPNSEYKLWIEINTLGYAIGEILTQQQPDESWKPILFLFQALNETKRNYEIYDQELLAIIIEIRHWRQYLLGRNEFKVWTNHKNLEYFRSLQKLNCCQAHWLAKLQDYNFKLIYKPESTMKRADALL